MTQTHVVLGAAGGLGSAIVRRLLGQGQAVRAVVRSADRARQVLPGNVHIEIADLTDPSSAQKACRDAHVLYHCVSVPFDSWESVLPRVHDNVLSCARHGNAVLLQPGNVYGYGPLQRTPAGEDHPLAATCRAGKLRNRLEADLLEADRAGHVRAVIERLPDLYGPNVTSRLTLPIFRAAMSGAAASWPGRADMPHDLLYVEDAAAAAIRLAGEPAAHGQAWHVPGPGPVTGRQFVEMVYAAAGTEPTIEPVRTDSLKFSGAAPTDTSELEDVMYLFERPMVLDGRKFARAFASFRYTPHKEGIRRTIEWLQDHSAV